MEGSKVAVIVTDFPRAEKRAFEKGFAIGQDIIWKHYLRRRYGWPRRWGLLRIARLEFSDHHFRNDVALEGLRFQL